MAVRLSRFIAWLLDACGADAAKTTRINLQACFPQLDEAQLQRLSRKSLQHMALLFFELAQLAYWPSTKLLKQISTVEGKALLDEAAASGEGVILLVPHFGNWEIFCAFLGTHYGFAALYDPPKIAALEPIILGARERFNGELFAIDTAGMRNLLRVLRQGKLVAILPDQVPSRNAGTHADFFGQPALTMTLVHRLVAKHPRRVIMGSVERVFNNRGYGYKITLEEVTKLQQPVSAQSSAEVINQAIEKVVQRSPEQYQWEYKRFKRPPKKGKDNIYRRQ